MISALLGLLAVVVAVGLGACYRELRITRRGLGALDEGLRRQLALLDDAQERRVTALAARLVGRAAPAGRPASPAVLGEEGGLPHAHVEEDSDDGEVEGETRLMKQPAETIVRSVTVADPDDEPTISAANTKAPGAMAPGSRLTHRR